MQAVTAEQQLQAAAYICAAHAIVTSSRHVVFVTHNDFQAVVLNDTVGLVPRWTGIAPHARPSQQILQVSSVLGMCSML